MKMQKRDKKNDFFKEFEDWHSNKYNDSYRYGNKTPFYFKKYNFLKIGILALVLPILCLIISIFLDLGIGFYVFFILMSIPGISLIIRYYK
ncbi:hypothetical protein BAX97_11805 [Elizabethkingia meningoseptica]|uniref:hypothetical protein n=1 Tax=Elizabethkingia meningoseptica TaxID=238 RepID=UPI0009370583|nr:hypothetical protein [Elizabethkingia meningoseptica]MDE5488636.1 hypothetical protein [Elizabethkingia meningoseptica]MVW92569.1 hypothetical protein [Elizabethkingia meningoseptica]OPC31966.1 hypothetical protein BAX97_11805 [Elizabethkingia meningoseptica]